MKCMYAPNLYKKKPLVYAWEPIDAFWHQAIIWIIADLLSILILVYRKIIVTFESKYNESPWFKNVVWQSFCLGPDVVYQF